MCRRKLPFRPRKLLLLGGIVFVCLLLGLSGSFIYSYPVRAASPAISNAARTPAGYVIASDHVDVQFEVTAGSSGRCCTRPITGLHRPLFRPAKSEPMAGMISCRQLCRPKQPIHGCNMPSMRPMEVVLPGGRTAIPTTTTTTTCMW